MAWLLRAAAALCLVWSIALAFARNVITAPAQQTQLAQAMANGQAVAYVVFAFLFWRAATESPPNRTVIIGATIFLVLRVVTDLNDLLVLTDAFYGLLSLADLVLCTGFAVGIIESMPRTFLGPENEKGRGS